MLPDFESFYQFNFKKLRNFLRRYLGDSKAAEDIAQDAFLQLWKNPNGYRPERGTLKAYLFGIATKRAADWARHHSRTETCSLEQPVGVQKSMSIAMADALDQLEPDMRALMWLREVEGYRHAELAAIFEIPEGTVKSRLYAGREQLRRIWESGAW
ncbi:MAG TPA: RNA polymerase sigma factor [Terriglobia bacterium]|nr:RNA polymerase sigma factor [Terriglobia bacterium]